MAHRVCLAPEVLLSTARARSILVVLLYDYYTNKANLTGQVTSMFKHYPEGHEIVFFAQIILASWETHFHSAKSSNCCANVCCEAVAMSLTRSQEAVMSRMNVTCDPD